MFIEEFRDAVTPALCEELVAFFERDPARKPSPVAVFKGKDGGAAQERTGAEAVNPALRTGEVLVLNTPASKGLFRKVIPAVIATMERYLAKHPGLAAFNAREPLQCTAPMIERVSPGQGFTWHHDHARFGAQRVVAGLLYLRTVTGGGQTEFTDPQVLVQPEAGKIVLFPPYWTHLHRGVTPATESKYVMSFFWTVPEKGAAK